MAVLTRKKGRGGRGARLLWRHRGPLLRFGSFSGASLAIVLAMTGAHAPAESHDMAGMHEVQVPAAAAIPLASVLPRTGWTATASDQETAAENGAAANVLDGNVSSIWHSKYSPSATALPHSLTIDMHAVTIVSGLRYLPRPATSSPNGRIGQFSISLSTDGTNWGAPVATGTWADDASEKSAAFATTSTRFVRLTALTEAGNRGPWSSAAELNLLGAPTSTPASLSLVNRTGFTATASDQETAAENGSAANVLDGDPATIWHSAWSGTPAPLPHSITIDMKRSIPLAGLRYLPRPNGGNGTIGQYQIALSPDGTTWSAPVAAGTWADDPTEKTATFTTTSARYVRLTALTEAGNRGPWSSAGEINLLQPVDPSVAGSWGPLINFPIVPVSSVLLPGNKLLTFSAYTATSFGNNDGYTQTAILDLNTGVVSQRQISNTGHEMFCTGLAVLPDGRVLVNGGSDAGKTSIYNPATDSWTAGPAMNIPRGYEGDTTLSDGSVFTLGGSWSGGQGGKDAEVFTPNGSWRLVPNVQATSILTSADPQGVYRADNHGWFFAVSGGGVFHAGPSKQMNWFTTAGNGSTTSAGTRGDSADAMNGNAVMYDIGKIFTSGGATAYQDADATNRAYTIDISKGPSRPVTVSRVGDMAYPRAFENSVVLPNGQVFVVGGQAHPVPFTDTGAAMSPELWTPATGAFTTMASQAVPRTYHSVALLLADGRVFSGGGGLCGTCATNHPDGQIFTPPYLLNADGSLKARPAITSAPSSAALGARITVQTSAAVSSFVLVRMGAVTHTVDSDQRRIPLVRVSTSGARSSLQIPSDAGVVLPGNYLLFAINSSGTPSVASTINIR